MTSESFIGHMFLLNLWAITTLLTIYGTIVYMEAKEASITGKKKLNFWLRQGDNKMNRLSWLLVFGLVGINTYYVYDMHQMQSENEGYINELISTDINIDTRLNEIVSKDFIMDVITIVGNNHEETTTEFKNDMEVLFKNNVKSMDESVNILKERVEIFGMAIDRWESSWDTKLKRNNEELVSTYEEKISNLDLLLTNEILNISNQLEDIDSLFIRLKEHRKTKGVFK